MSLKEISYSVLVVSAAEKLNQGIVSLFHEAGYEDIRLLSNAASARREWTRRSYDFVVINTPLPDESGVRLAVSLSDAKDTIILLLLRSETADEITEKVCRSGIFTLPKPFSRQTFSRACSWMQSAREKLRMLEKKTLSLEEKMEEIRLVNHAKWLLISTLSMTEADAHHHIEKQAMNRGMSKREIAEEIIGMYS